MKLYRSSRVSTSRVNLIVNMLTLCWVAFFSTSISAALPTEVDSQPLPSLAPVLQRVQKSTVKLDIETFVRKRRGGAFFKDPFFSRFLEQRQSNGQPLTKTSIGSGVIIDAQQGLILTNEHSIDNAKRIMVSLHDGRQIEARLLGQDKGSDVAILQIPAENLAAIPLASSEALNIGDFVVSISHVLGAQSTFTSGIVSGLAKTGYSTQNFQSYIQTDAGAGAGLLINLNGELVGLNIAKVAQTEGSARIGFATPIDVALKVRDQLLEYGTIQRGYLAIQVQNLTRGLAQSFDIDHVGGALVTNVVDGSSAAQAGMKVGDIIIEADSVKVNHSVDLRNAIGSQFSGDSVQLTVLREGKRKVFPAVLESSSPIARQDSMIHYQLEGATFSERASSVANKKNGDIVASLDANPGVMVSEVKPGSVAWDHGMREKDLVVSANRAPVNDLDSFRDAVSQKDVLMLNIMRENRALFLLLK